MLSLRHEDRGLVTMGRLNGLRVTALAFHLIHYAFAAYKLEDRQHFEGVWELVLLEGRGRIVFRWLPLLQSQLYMSEKGRYARCERWRGAAGFRNVGVVGGRKL